MGARAFTGTGSPKTQKNEKRTLSRNRFFKIIRHHRFGRLQDLKMDCYYRHFLLKRPIR